MRLTLNLFYIHTHSSLRYRHMNPLLTLRQKWHSLDNQESSWWSPWSLASIFFALFYGSAEILWIIIQQTPVAPQYAILYCKVPLHWAEQLLWTRLQSAMSFHSGSCPRLYFLQNQSYLAALSLEGGRYQLSVGKYNSLHLPDVCPPSTCWQWNQSVFQLPLCPDCQRPQHPHRLDNDLGGWFRLPKAITK
jgi:hypothetical protein